MKLVIGGCFQGKRDYVQKTWKIPNEQIADGNTCSLLEAIHYPVIDALDQLIYRTMNLPWEEICEWIDCYCKQHPDSILICCEVGCGVVPIDRHERDYRERLGRICCLLAERADFVARIYCGLAQILKQEETKWKSY
jgi:adenosylcobinamide kinase/adenosylcobinamide-phosphate guanylyltransferase